MSIPEGRNTIQESSETISVCFVLEQFFNEGIKKKGKQRINILSSFPVFQAL